jgi:two-component system sensor histidine kinase KdpD
MTYNRLVMAKVSDIVVRAASRDNRVGAGAAVAGTAVLTGGLAPFHDEVGLLNEGLIFLLFVLLISATWGWKVGLFAAVITNLALNFFFVDPLHTFTVQRPRDLVALFIFLVVSLVGGSMLSRARDAARTARQRQAETTVLLDLSRELIGRAEPAEALSTLCESAVRALQARGASVLSPAGDTWTVLASAGGGNARRRTTRDESLRATEALATGSTLTLGRIGLPSERRRRVAVPGRGVVELIEGVAFVPLRVGDRPLGVLCLDGPIGDTPFREHPEDLLNAFAREAALGVQRVELAYEAAHAEALREADELKTALMASISHDLKTPLAGIKTSASSLLDKSVAWSADDVQVFLETIDSQADRLNRVISDILDLNRIESGVVTPVRRRLSARQLLDEAVERTRTPAAGRAVSVDAPDELLVETDEALMLQALVNLIENAAKYSTPGGAICLRAERTANGTELSVSDEGPGIPEQDIPHIFERFYRAADQSRRVKGSGLGLAIVKGFVTLSGGTVRVESSAGGTRFVITFPAAVETGAA